MEWERENGERELMIMSKSRFAYCFEAERLFRFEHTTVSPNSINYMSEKGRRLWSDGLTIGVREN